MNSSASLKPGGEIILVNHLGAEAGLRAIFEHWFAPLARRLGWRPEFSGRRLAQWAEAPRRRAGHRAPRHAAARAVLADPLCAAETIAERALCRGKGFVR